MLASISTLHFNSSPIRVTSIDAQPWFIAADVFKALGIQNCTAAVKALGRDEVRLTNVIAQRSVQALSVQGLRRKLKRSRKPEALVLLEWAECEAIPAYKEASEAVRAVKRSNLDDVSRLAARVADLEQQLSTLSAATLDAMQTPLQRQCREL